LNQSINILGTKQQDPMYAICSRGDLASGDAKKAVGCYDTKVSSFSSWGGPHMLHAKIINGPTRGNRGEGREGNDVDGDDKYNKNSGLPAFHWDQDKTFDGIHKGLPNKYEFEWMSVSKCTHADKESNVIVQDAEVE
jgi:hypothetical protein